MTRKPWADKGSRHSRGYGAGWDKLREAALLRDQYLCQRCLRDGKLTPLCVRRYDHAVDHVVPKAFGGTDTLDNTESLCQACHKAKSSIELGFKPKQIIGADGWIAKEKLKRFGFSIPDGIQPSSIPVNLVCGPPASGKTTYIAAHAGPGDAVIDFDVYLKQLGAKKWTINPEAVKKAFLIRDARLRALSSARHGQAWVIAMAPSRAERNAWAEALGRVRVVMLDVPADVCIARLGRDEDREHAKGRMVSVIKSWWSDYEPVAPSDRA